MSTAAHSSEPASGGTISLSGNPGEAHAHHAEPHHTHAPHVHGGGDHAEGEGGCAHAAVRAIEAPAALAAADALCRERGVRLTALRRAVLEALYRTHRPMGAYDLAEALGGESQRRVAPITIYRVLDFLTEHGFVHRLASKNAFIACPHRHEPGDMTVFLICEACGGVDEVTSPGLRAAVADLLDHGRFMPRAQIIEIEGLCAHCRPRREAAESA